MLQIENARLSRSSSRVQHIGSRSSEPLSSGPAGGDEARNHAESDRRHGQAPTLTRKLPLKDPFRRSVFGVSTLGAIRITHYDE